MTQPIGAAWLHGLQMVIVPLVVGLLVTGIGATTDAARAGRITMRAMVMIVVILWSSTIMSALVMPLILDAFPLPRGLGAALCAALTGAASWVTGEDYLRSGVLSLDLPVLGVVKLTSALAFDTGVFLVVVGLVLALLRTLGAEAER